MRKTLTINDIVHMFKKLKIILNMFELEYSHIKYYSTKDPAVTV